MSYNWSLQPIWLFCTVILIAYQVQNMYRKKCVKFKNRLNEKRKIITESKKEENFLKLNSSVKKKTLSSNQSHGFKIQQKSFLPFFCF